MKLLKIKELSPTLEERTVSIGENDLFRIYSIYKNIKLNKSDLIENIIKVQIPLDIEEAKKILNEGLKYNDKTYISLLTTPSLMKHEDSEMAYKCEYFFIKEEDKDFIKVLEDVASLGKLKDKYNTSLCINKDIISRLGLLASTGDSVYLPNLKKAILPEMTYTYIANYLQFAEKNNDIDLENLRLEKHKDLEVKHIAMDGSGFMMPSIAQEIQSKLHMNYDLDFIGFRTVGDAGKGLLVKFNWKEYIKQEYGLDTLIVKDFWGNNIDLMQVDMVLNASQVKWAKWFNGAEEIENLKSNYKDYYKILNSFTITKVNKKELKTHTLSNYQILSNLNLTEKELQEISKDTEEIYKKVIDKDVNATRILLGDIAREDMDVLSASTKAHKLLQLQENLINIKSVKYTVNSMLNKKVHQLAGAKMYLKGNYKVVCKDPISYFDSLVEQNFKNGNLQGKISKNGLKHKTNYCPGEYGFRTLARCPLNSATEILKTELVKNKLLDRYFGSLTSEILFYAFDDNMMLQSGEDEDTDISICIDNKTVYNAVIEDIDQEGIKWNFRNQFDGGTYKCIYVKENIIDCTLSMAGNSIGKLSNIGAKISNKIQEYTYIHNNKYFTYTALKDGLSKKKTFKDNKEFNTFLDKLVEANKIKDYAKMTEEERKTATLKLFNKHKMYSYYTLFLQMVAIDSVKSGKKVDKEMESLIADYKKLKKPEYLYHAKWTSGEHKPDYNKHKWSNTLLCNNAKRINKNLGYKTRQEVQYSDKALFNAIYTKELESNINADLVNIIEELHKQYNYKRSLIRAEFTDSNKVNEEFNKIDVEIAEEWDKLIKDKYSIDDICMAICTAGVNGCRCSSRFMLMFAWNNILKKLLQKNNGLGTAYQEVKGNAGFNYFFKNWKKVNIDLDKEDNLGEKEIAKKYIKLNRAVKIRIKNLTENELTKEIKVDGDKVLNSNGELLGNLFPEFLNLVTNGQVYSKEIAKTGKSMTINLLVA